MASEYLRSHLGPPILMQPDASWSNSYHRVLWIGQETRGWQQTSKGKAETDRHWHYPQDLETLGNFYDLEWSIEALLLSYTQFGFGEQWGGQLLNAPFWGLFSQSTPTIRGKQHNFYVVYQFASLRCNRGLQLQDQ